MKKTLKILSIVLVAVVMLFAFTQPVSLAADPTSIINQTKNNGNGLPGEAGNLFGTIINWIWGISILIAIVVVMIIGVKFIIGGTQEKAEYKKSLMPVVIGVILVVFATTIVKVLFSLGN